MVGAEGGGGGAEVAAESAAEVVGVGPADPHADVGDGVVGLDEQARGAFASPFQKHGDGALAGVSAEQSHEIETIDPADARHLIQRPIGGEVVAHRLHDAAHGRMHGRTGTLPITAGMEHVGHRGQENKQASEPFGLVGGIGQFPQRDQGLGQSASAESPFDDAPPFIRRLRRRRHGPEQPAQGRVFSGPCQFIFEQAFADAAVPDFQAAALFVSVPLSRADHQHIAGAQGFVAVEGAVDAAPGEHQHDFKKVMIVGCDIGADGDGAREQAGLFHRLVCANSQPRLMSNHAANLRNGDVNVNSVRTLRGGSLGNRILRMWVEKGENSPQRRGEENWNHR